VDISGFKDKLLDNDFSHAFFKEQKFGQYTPYFDI